MLQQLISSITIEHGRYVWRMRWMDSVADRDCVQTAEAMSRKHRCQRAAQRAPTTATLKSIHAPPYGANRQLSQVWCAATYKSTAGTLHGHDQLEHELIVWFL
jgi:hypothetical protein